MLYQDPQEKRLAGFPPVLDEAKLILAMSGE